MLERFDCVFFSPRAATGGGEKRRGGGKNVAFQRHFDLSPFSRIPFKRIRVTNHPERKRHRSVRREEFSYLVVISAFG